jgi:hypothetical protein
MLDRQPGYASHGIKSSTTNYDFRESFDIVAATHIYTIVLRPEIPGVRDIHRLNRASNEELDN